MMRILHIGWGFRPFRWGGLIEYLETVSRQQAKDGHQVGYFFAGRYSLTGGTRLRRWTREGVTCFEIVNSPVVVGMDKGTRFPESDTNNTEVERLFDQVLSEFTPDVIHVQEITGLTANCLRLAKAKGIPMVMSLHDFFPICPTVKLVDHQGKNCSDFDLGEKCRTCCFKAPHNALHLVQETLISEVVEKFEGTILAVQKILKSKAKTVKKLPVSLNTTSSHTIQTKIPTKAPATAYAHRRKRIVEAMNDIDMLLATSSSTRNIYLNHGLIETKVRVLNPINEGLSAVNPRLAGQKNILTFGTLNGFASREKGGELLLEAMVILKQKGVHEFQLVSYGTVHPAFVQKIAEFPQIHIKGTYQKAELDHVLDSFDVGLIPSIWEEAYGLVGPEMLSKGNPIVANNIGGMPEYTLEGETGWLNMDCSAAGMAAIIERLIAKPYQVSEVSANILAKRASFASSVRQHCQTLEQIYNSIVDLNL